MPPPTSYTTHPSLTPFLTPPSVFLHQNPHINVLLTGALVTSPTGHILLLRRAAHDSWPLLWEVPGGCVETTDNSYIAAAVRELWEESGLRAKHILRAVHLIAAAPIDNDAEKERDRLEEEAVMDGDVCVFYAEGAAWGKLTVWVEVESCEDVRIDGEEHAEWAWVSEEEVKGGRFGDGRVLEMVSDGVRRSVLEGFRLWRERNDVECDGESQS